MQRVGVKLDLFAICISLIIGILTRLCIFGKLMCFHLKLTDSDYRAILSRAWLLIARAYLLLYKRKAFLKKRIS